MGVRLRTLLLSPRTLAWPTGHALAQTRDRRRLWQLGGGLAVAWLLATLLRPISVTVDGEWLLMPRRVTAGEAARLAGHSLQPGDLVDVGGLVLRPAAGYPAALLRNGLVVAPDERLRRRDALTVLPGRHRMEPYHEHARLLRARAPGFAPAGVAGVRRTLEGQWSGRQVARVSTVRATVPAGAVPRKRLALTFDDGPWPGTTAQLLAILKRHDAYATFFVLGNLARARPQLVRQAVAQGCEIGIHSWNHASYTRQGAAGVRLDLQRCAAQLRPLAGRPLRYVRPPYGATNGSVRAAITGGGYRQVLWAIDTNDWRRPGANAIAYRVLSQARDGAIVLAHDGGGDRSGTVAAMATVVPTLQRRGYALVTLTELFSGQPGAVGGEITLPDGQRFAARPSVPGLAVVVDGAVAELPEPPVEINDHLLLPVKPVLDMLHVKYMWDTGAQTLELDGSRARLKLRFNDRRVETARGETHETPVPPIIYRGRPMVPLPLILEASGATASYDRETRVLTLTSVAGLMRESRLGRSRPPEWLAGQPWTAQYSALP